jgi:hypothetical protein
MKIGTLVALYGDKPTKLAHLISECQARISSSAGSAFHPYDLRQIHGTIVSIGQPNASWSDERFYKYYGQHMQRNFDGFFHFLRNSGCFPFQIQVGGFQERDYPFVSRGTRPYERSFNLQDGNAVVIGWPIRGAPVTKQRLTLTDLIHESRIYPNTLDEIRQSLKGFGFLHSYFQRLEDVDNDFYFRIGLYEPVLLPESKQQLIEKDLRDFLRDLEPVILEIALSDLYLAFSDKETLPISSTKVLSVSDPNVTADSIMRIYDDQNSKGR